MSPPTRESRPHKETGAQESTATKTSSTVTPADVDSLRLRLIEAQRLGDELAVRSICNQVDDIFVSRNWRHADDPEIRRLRRALRAAS